MEKKNRKRKKIREKRKKKKKKNAQKGIREIEGEEEKGEGEEGGKFMEQLRIEFDAVQGQSVAKALSAYLPECPW